MEHIAIGFMIIIGTAALIGAVGGAIGGRVCGHRFGRRWEPAVA
jgi:hypothetical protein